MAALLYDGALADLKRQLWRETTVKFDLKDRENARRFEQLELRRHSREKLGDLTYCSLSARRPSHRRGDPPGGDSRSRCWTSPSRSQSIEEVVSGSTWARHPGGAAVPSVGLEFARIGFMNMLAFRLRYYTGVITYFINVTVYYFILARHYHVDPHFANFNFAQMITYVAVGWIIRSMYFNTSTRRWPENILEGKITMVCLKR